MDEQKGEPHVCSGLREDYSTSQWAKKSSQRRCKTCVGNPPDVGGDTYCAVEHCPRKRQSHHPLYCAPHAANTECAENCGAGDDAHTHKCLTLTLLKTLKRQLNTAIGRVASDLSMFQTSTTANEITANLKNLLNEVQTTTPQVTDIAQSTEDAESSGPTQRRQQPPPPHWAEVERRVRMAQATIPCHCPAEQCSNDAELLPALGGHPYCQYCGPCTCSAACICACGAECSDAEYDDGH